MKHERLEAPRADTREEIREVLASYLDAYPVELLDILELRFDKLVTRALGLSSGLEAAESKIEQIRELGNDYSPYAKQVQAILDAGADA